MEKFGTKYTALYRSETGDFVSLANWQSKDTWTVWKEEYKDHPMRLKYREYKTATSECMLPIVTLHK